MLCVRELRQHKLNGNADNSRVSAHGVDLVSLTDPTLLLFRSAAHAWLVVACLCCFCVHQVLERHSESQLLAGSHTFCLFFLLIIFGGRPKFVKSVTMTKTTNENNKPVSLGRPAQSVNKSKKKEPPAEAKAAKKTTKAAGKKKQVLVLSMASENIISFRFLLVVLSKSMLTISSFHAI
jgi:hypothetical protein